MTTENRPEPVDPQPQAPEPSAEPPASEPSPGEGGPVEIIPEIIEKGLDDGEGRPSNPQRTEDNN